MQVRTILSALVVLLIAGCDSGSPDARARRGEFKPIEGGFGYGVRSKGFLHRRVGASLQYRDSKGTMTEVWPYVTILSSDSVQITNRTAVLIGGKADLYSDGKERLTDRLIAFEAPAGPPLDITDEVLRKWCKESGVEITNIVKDPFVSLAKTNGALKVEFIYLNRNQRGPGSVNAADGTATISWDDLDAIIQDIKANGKPRREKWSGVEYLQKD